MEHFLEIGTEFSRSQRELDVIKRNMDGAVGVLERARALGIKVLCGTDTGNSPVMPYGELHVREPEILVRCGGYTPMEAIVSCTRDNAFAIGLENEVGVIEGGKLADIIILKADPLADIRVLQGGRNLGHSHQRRQDSGPERGMGQKRACWSYRRRPPRLGKARLCPGSCLTSLTMKHGPGRFCPEPSSRCWMVAPSMGSHSGVPGLH